MKIIDKEMLSVDKLIIKRDKINILNNIEYDIHKFIIVGQYIDDKTCRFIIRNMNSCFGWSEDLKIIIDNKELNLGKSETNTKEITFVSDSILFIPNNNYFCDQKIPKIIVQTTEKNLFTQLHYNTIMSFVDLNPEYTYMYFDSYDRRKFIKENYDKEVLNSYDILIPGAYQSDLFRICFLYKYGGCYFDCKNICKLPLNQIILKHETEIICEDRNKNFNCNGILISEAQNPFLKDYINKIIHNCNHKIFGVNSIDITGPNVLTEFTKNMKPRLKNNFHGHGNINSSFIDINTKQIIALPCYKNYYQEYQKNFNQEYYDDLWHKREVFYDKIFENEKFTLFGISKYKIRDKSVIIKNNKYIINTNYFDIKARIINSLNNEVKNFILKSRLIVKIIS
jgi:hypothetical protein